ncbi:MAG: hypothetical protein IT182_07535 [Acidobacteria bacterium]|nr:hypothetical protein [Acidobacteriota bacterium]
MPLGRTATWSVRVALGVLLAVAMTWPMAARFGSAARLNFGDGEWSLWSVTWVAHALTTEPTALFQANIFHPDRDTLAYSEANVVTGALGVPFHLATGGNPYATHNGAIMTGLVLSFVLAWAFAESLGATAAASAAFAIAFTYCPYLFARTAHIQLMMTFGMPLALQAFHRIVERPTARGGAWLGVALAIQALACAYFGIFAGLTVGLGTVFYGVSRGLWRVRSYWTAIATGAVTSLAIVGPFFVPYVRVKQDFGFTRLLEDAAMYSADWQAWLASSAWAHRWMLPWLGQWNEVLFPGFLLTALAVVGLVVGLRRQRLGLGEPTLPSSSDVEAESALRARPDLLLGPVRRRETTLFYGLVAAIAFWASFGPKAGLYTVLYHAIPVFTFLRAPGRFGILVVLALGVLALVALQTLLERRTPRTRTIASVLVAALFCAEYATAPIRLENGPTVPDVYRRLATLPRGAVVELPFWYIRSDFPRHARYMLYSTYHWQPMVNGYSDHIPQWFRDEVVRISSFPTADSLQVLVDRHQARYAIFHARLYDSVSRQRLRERLEQYAAYVRPVSIESDVWLYEIIGVPR